MRDRCEESILEAALAGMLPVEEETALNKHLDTCEVCAATMERLAGRESVRSAIAELLPTDELDAAAPGGEADDWSDIDFTVEHLEPATEPHTLGRLGEYDVLEVIGRGGMGIVLKAYDRELKRCVAIKLLSPHLARNSSARKRFAREAQAAAAVVHPNVLAIHQVKATGRMPFLVMPLVAGESLAQRLATRGPLELKETLRIGIQAAAGLAAAHEQGLVHRDVKPANILLEPGVERAVLTDFGLARAADDATLTRWGVVAGTPQYMSPEQARGEALDARSDLFSLGCVLYEMVTGVSPFRADSAMASMRRLIDEQPPAIAALNAETPPWLIGLIGRLLEKDPVRRYGSARAVSELLGACLAHVQQPTVVPLSKELHALGARGARRRPLFRWLAAGAIGSLLILSGLLLLRDWNRAPVTIASGPKAELADTESLESEGLGAINANSADLDKDAATAPATRHDSPNGFATVGGVITGGAGGQTVIVTNAAELKKYAGDNEPYVIYVQGTIPIVKMETHVLPNKTILGLGPDATLTGGGLQLHRSRNVIIRNLTIRESSNDGLSLLYSNNVWIDHCTLLDSLDGDIDIRRASDNITVSWCKFARTPPNEYGLACLLGASDDETINEGNLHVTFHHNYFGQGIRERMPSVRFGKAHVYNNYYNCTDNAHCVRIRLSAQGLIENNCFEGVRNPWELYVTRSEHFLGKIKAKGNLETNVTWGQASTSTDDGAVIRIVRGTDDVLPPPYQYKLQPASEVREAVTSGAGAGKIELDTPLSADRPGMPLHGEREHAGDGPRHKSFQRQRSAALCFVTRRRRPLSNARQHPPTNCWVQYRLRQSPGKPRRDGKTSSQVAETPKVPAGAIGGRRARSFREHLIRV